MVSIDVHHPRFKENCGYVTDGYVSLLAVVHIDLLYH